MLFLLEKSKCENLSLKYLWSILSDVLEQKSASKKSPFNDRQESSVHGAGLILYNTNQLSSHNILLNLTRCACKCLLVCPKYQRLLNYNSYLFRNYLLKKNVTCVSNKNARAAVNIKAKAQSVQVWSK